MFIMPIQFFLNTRSIFEQNHAKIAEHNAKFAAGQVSWYMKETEDMDLTEQEFLNKRTGEFFINMQIIICKS